VKQAADLSHYHFIKRTSLLADQVCPPRTEKQERKETRLQRGDALKAKFPKQ